MKTATYSPEDNKLRLFNRSPPNGATFPPGRSPRLVQT